MPRSPWKPPISCCPTIANRGPATPPLALATGLDLGHGPGIGTLRLDADRPRSRTPRKVSRSAHRYGPVPSTSCIRILRCRGVGFPCTALRRLGWRTGGPVTLDGLVVRAGDSCPDGHRRARLEEGRLDLAPALARRGRGSRALRPRTEAAAGRAACRPPDRRGRTHCRGAFASPARHGNRPFASAEAVPPHSFAGDHPRG